MKPLKVLITNNTLAGRAGSELYALEVASELKRRGHHPVAYSQILGEVANEMISVGIPVVSDLNLLADAPDIIHGHHHIETLTALLHFPNAPAVSYCHGYLPWQEHPPIFPRILRYVAVDAACMERLCENGIPAGKCRMIHNFVDLRRFISRSQLPTRPLRALIYSNYAQEDGFIPMIRQACLTSGIELDIVGMGVRNTTSSPEQILPQYDLVFAKARSALEALAVGCAVITCDTRGLGAMVTLENLDKFRAFNFGFRTLTQPFQLELILKEIASYDARECQKVSEKIRGIAGMRNAMDNLMGVYAEVLEEHRLLKVNREAELIEMGQYLAWFSRQVKGQVDKNHYSAQKQVEGSLITAQKREADALKSELTSRSQKLEEANRQIDSLREQISAYENSTCWKVTTPLRATKKFLNSLKK